MRNYFAEAVSDDRTGDNDRAEGNDLHVDEESNRHHFNFQWQTLLGHTRAGLHDNVPDRPSAKVEPTGCQLATMSLKIKTVTVPKGGLHGGRSCHPIWDVSTSGLSCTKLSRTFCHFRRKSDGTNTNHLNGRYCWYRPCNTHHFNGRHCCYRPRTPTHIISMTDTAATDPEHQRTSFQRQTLLVQTRRPTHIISMTDTASTDQETNAHHVNSRHCYYKPGDQHTSFQRQTLLLQTNAHYFNDRHCQYIPGDQRTSFQ